MADTMGEQGIDRGRNTGMLPEKAPNDGLRCSSVGGNESRALIPFSNVAVSSACLAHDMGNLLQVASSALNLISRSVKREQPEQIEDLCDKARGALNRIAWLRRQILDLARIAAEVPLPVAPASVIQSMEGIIQLTLGPRIVLTVCCAKELPNILCEVQELENAILNLVGNARDAMPLGGHLSLILDREYRPWKGGVTSESSCPCFVLKVADTGRGIPADVLEKVFDPFFSTKPPGRGTGLGLPTVAAFARRVGGTVEIETGFGKGTTVVLRLPGISVHG
jgi:signal transduction histidine kinase